MEVEYNGSNIQEQGWYPEMNNYRGIKLLSILWRYGESSGYVGKKRSVYFR